jgi:predicted nucleic acid-binding protein
MRVVIDTNIAFSAILNGKSKIANIILKPKSKYNFYSTKQLQIELNNHRVKLQNLSKLNGQEFQVLFDLILSKIKFIDVELIPQKLFQISLKLTQDIDIDDTEFVALTEHCKGKLWSGDKPLKTGLKGKGWNKFIEIGEMAEN